jgi:hypothetical protein
MPILRPILTTCFLAAFGAYYLIVWKIRGERLRASPSVFLLISNPFAVRRSDLTARGRRLYGLLLVALAAIVAFGLAAVAAVEGNLSLP